MGLPDIGLRRQRLAGAGRVMPSTAARRARSAGVRVFMAGQLLTIGRAFASISR